MQGFPILDYRCSRLSIVLVNMPRSRHQVHGRSHGKTCTTHKAKVKVFHARSSFTVPCGSCRPYCSIPANAASKCTLGPKKALPRRRLWINSSLDLKRSDKSRPRHRDLGGAIGQRPHRWCASIRSPFVGGTAWIINGLGTEIFQFYDGLDKVMFIASFIAALELLRHWPSINRIAATGAKNHPIHTDMTVIFKSKLRMESCCFSTKNPSTSRNDTQE